MGCCNTTLRLKDKARKNIDECYDLLDTGDLVLMQLRLRNGCPIETATCATFSHVGVIIREQTPHYTSIYVSHSLNNRVSRHTLRGVLTKVKGGFRAVCARKLKTPLSPDQKERLIEYCNRNVGRSYNTDFMELARAGLGERTCHLCKGCFPKDEDVDDDKPVFCSEYVAMVYQRIGLMTNTKQASLYTPHDFCESRAHPDIQHLFSDTLVLNQMQRPEYRPLLSRATSEGNAAVSAGTGATAATPDAAAAAAADADADADIDADADAGVSLDGVHLMGVRSRSRSNSKAKMEEKYRKHCNHNHNHDHDFGEMRPLGRLRTHGGGRRGSDNSNGRVKNGDDGGNGNTISSSNSKGTDDDNGHAHHRQGNGSDRSRINHPVTQCNDNDNDNDDEDDEDKDYDVRESILKKPSSTGKRGRGKRKGKKRHSNSSLR